MNKTYLSAVNNAMDLVMQNDESVVLIGEDIGAYGGGMGVTKGLIDKYASRRVMDVPITETAFTGAAVGAAILGMKPIVEIIFSDFTSLTIDPIVNHAAKLHFMSAGKINVPIVVRTPLGAGTGAAAQHSQSVESMYLNTPGLVVLAPATAYDAKGLMISAVNCKDPVMFFEHKLLYKTEGDYPDEMYSVPIGKANVMKKGSDITLIAYSYMSIVCKEAAKALESEGISAEVVDLRTLRPLDKTTVIESVMKNKRALVVQEAPLFGGFSSEIASMISDELFNELLCPVKRLGGDEMPIAYSEEIERMQLPNVEKIVKQVKEMMK